MLNKSISFICFLKNKEQGKNNAIYELKKNSDPPLCLAKIINLTKRLLFDKD